MRAVQNAKLSKLGQQCLNLRPAEGLIAFNGVLAGRLGENLALSAGHVRSSACRELKEHFPKESSGLRLLKDIRDGENLDTRTLPLLPRRIRSAGKSPHFAQAAPFLRA